MPILFDPIVLQDQARDQLLSLPPFANIPVVSADPGDINTQINIALERLGIGAQILVPNMHASNKNQPGPYFDKIRLIAEVIENPTLNRDVNLNPDYLTAQQVAMLVAAGLHWYAPAGINERFYVTDVASVPVPKLKDGKVFNIFHVELTGGGGIDYSMPKIAPVTATPVGPGPQLVTLGCATAGAAIWYTLDRSYPSPRNPSARMALLQASNAVTNDDGTVIYNLDGQPVLNEPGMVNYPIFVDAGKTLAARAWLQGYLPTKPDQFIFKY